MVDITYLDNHKHRDTLWGNSQVLGSISNNVHYFGSILYQAVIFFGWVSTDAILVAFMRDGLQKSCCTRCIFGNPDSTWGCATTSLLFWSNIDVYRSEHCCQSEVHDFLVASWGLSKIVYPQWYTVCTFHWGSIPNGPLADRWSKTKSKNANYQLRLAAYTIIYNGFLTVPIIFFAWFQPSAVIQLTEDLDFLDTYFWFQFPFFFKGWVLPPYLWLYLVVAKVTNIEHSISNLQVEAI